MLKSLSVSNVAIIERLELELGSGFNVLTGETGAGKSIIIDSVNLILGERASRELIKYGTDKASVEAELDVSDSLAAVNELAAMELDDLDPHSVTVSRELGMNGKNVCRINGTLVSLAALKRFTDLIVDLHGQHEHQSLLNPARHIEFLDNYAKGGISDAKAEVRQLFIQYKDVRSRLLSGFGSFEERAREMDILAFQIQEIEAAQLSPDEEERLEAELKVLSNAERIENSLSVAHASLSGDEGGLTLLDAARRELAGIADFGEQYDALTKKLDDVYYALEDAAIQVRSEKLNFEFDPERLNEIENRLEQILNLKRKYGGTVEKVLAFMEKARERLDMLKNADEMQAELTAELNKCESRYKAAAEKLTALRHDAADRLNSELIAQLSDLGLTKAKFGVEFSGDAQPFSANGVDKLEFLLSTNPGEPLKPLSKVASGGEMSRIMLGFKAIFADNDEISTLIFDEIDTGISGHAASVVGGKMVKIADKHQVICVTHLPQIAALADRHYLVEKHDDGEKTSTGIKLLDYDGRCEAVAAMMGGEHGSDAALIHAKELIDACELEKTKRRNKE